MFFKTKYRLAAVLLFVNVSAFAADSGYLQRAEVRAYIDELVTQHQFDKKFLIDIFRSVKTQKYALKAIEQPYEAKPWYLYHRQFLTDERIKAGIQFWHQHKEIIKAVEQRYQVPAEVILAVAGVETYYGKITGKLPVLDTLVTLGFDYPRRAEFFRGELTNLFLLGREENLLYEDLKGSYAGAMGIGQFIPSSYRAYAVDFDQDKVRNLWGSIPDALASIANYLAQHGWVMDGAIASVIKLRGDIDGLRINEEFKPFLTQSDLAAMKVVNLTDFMEDKFALFSYLTDKDTQEYWAGYQNFYTITRYNRSRRYAMAVYQLSRALKSEYSAAFGKG